MAQCFKTILVFQSIVVQCQLKQDRGCGGMVSRVTNESDEQMYATNTHPSMMCVPVRAPVDKHDRFLNIIRATRQFFF